MTDTVLKNGKKLKRVSLNDCVIKTYTVIDKYQPNGIPERDRILTDSEITHLQEPVGVLPN